MLKYIFILLLIPTLSFAEEIRLMTWNVFMLPKPIKNSHQKVRSEYIGEYLWSSDYDVIFLQEAFSGGFRKTVNKHLMGRYHYTSRLKKKKVIYPFMNPGLVAYSKYPMKDIDHVYFDKCGKADCHSSKGAHLMEIELPSGKQIQIANTHMQSGGQEKYREIRKRQLEQIQEMMKRNKKPGVPQLLVGDLNVDAIKGNEFSSTLDALGMNSVGETFQPLFAKDDSDTDSESNEKKPLSERISDFFSAGFAADCIKEQGEANHKLLDHVLYLDLDQKMKFTSDIIGNPEFNLKGKSCPLSDHKPRIVTIEI